MEFLTRQKRYGQILGLLSKHDMAWLLDKMGLTRLVPDEYKREEDETLRTLSNAEHMRVLFEELGPTFVKMGQILSTRPDLIPTDYIAEFKKLQDQATTVPFEEIRGVVEAEFGATLDEVFAHVEPEPLAAASIGQVHRVTLLDGTAAVVKVQRPEIEDNIRMDIALLRNFAELAARTGAAGPIDVVGIVREFERWILRELDYVLEGQLTDKFRHQHAEDDQLVIPKVFWDTTRKRVLTMEYIDGIKVSEIDRLRAADHDCRAIAHKVFHVILEQVYVHGWFHADPHPGNLIVLEDGRLCMLDFGMHGHFDRYTKRALADLVKDSAEHDYVRMADHLLQHGLISYEADLRSVRQDLRELFRSASGGGGELSDQLRLLIQFVVDHKIAFPPDLYFLDKVFGTLDGAAKTLDPSLDSQKILEDFMPTLAAAEAGDWKGMAQRLIQRTIEVEDTMFDLPGETYQALKRVNAGYLTVRSRMEITDEGNRKVSRLALKVGGLGLGLVGFLSFALSAGGETVLPPVAVASLAVGVIAFGGSAVALLRVP